MSDTSSAGTSQTVETRAKAPAVSSSSSSRAAIGLPAFPLELPRRSSGLLVFALMVILPTFIAFVYYDLLAAPQYQTQATFAIRSTSDHYGSETGGGAGIFGPPTGPVSATQSYGLLSYLNSAPAIEDLTQTGVNVRGMLSSSRADFLSRLSSHAKIEDVVADWRKKVRLQYDVTKGIITLNTYAFTANDSYTLADGVLQLSERMANTISQRVQQDAVKYAEESLKETEKNLTETRNRLADFRARTGVVDAERSNQSEINMEQALRQALFAAQSQADDLRRSGGMNSPALASLQQKITTIKSQISEIHQRVSGGSADHAAAPTEGWASVMDTNTLLLDQMKEAQTHYDEARNTLRELRQNAVKQNAYVLIYVRPVKAGEATFPRYLLSPLTVTGCAFIAWAISLLLFYALRDSR
ncbi:hypothetical protein KOEU_14820 [Komagataeibacter europaeus]|uniref:Uncharacterized protein n=2 Tax=Komagataeibacter europaeus TaxID=33995 RepID=A0A0M0EHT6_KOMEU|nr:hypothetical protein [Komagataeibacter europaeus]KON64837.1 hypothetical protein KOEU_14820 [Komagataeibacter europaeus]GBQ42174.1 capsule polysaccharide export-like protein [Komagataeibacter europaeus LMG 18890]